MKIKTVLLVEDDDVTNFVNKEIFEETGLFEEVHIQENGKTALDFIRREGVPDLIILDVNMPEMGGADFVKAMQLEGLNPKPPVCVMLTTPLTDEERKIFEESGMIVSYKEKPLSPDDVLDLVNKLKGIK